MKIIGEIDLKGINQIVINRSQVWDRITSKLWEKCVYNQANIRTSVRHKDNSQMMKLVNGLLDRRVDPKPLHIGGRVNFPLLVMVCEDRAYRCWQHGQTLNVVRKGLR